MAQLSAFALACTLKPSPSRSSSELIGRQLLDEMAKYDTAGELLRVADFDVKPGVEVDMGDGDQWPQLREKILAADIFVLTTPTWLGHMSSIAQRVLERLDADLAITDDAGRPVMVGKVAVVAVVGNEDGAHKIIADTFQGLNDVGFSIPAQGGTYWNGEAMSPGDYIDLEQTPSAVQSTNESLARNAVHLARLLQREQYPAYE